MCVCVCVSQLLRPDMGLGRHSVGSVLRPLCPHSHTRHLSPPPCTHTHTHIYGVGGAHSDFLLLRPIKAAVSPEPDERLTQMREYLQRFESSPEDLDSRPCLAQFKSGLNPDYGLYLQR